MRRATPLVLVGFAAETGDLLRKAREKRARKHVDLMVANDVTTPGAGFEVDTNAVTLIGADREETLPLQSKARVAEAILDRVEQLLRARAAVKS
jgi:phosphopantothenoylcysteine decarboxylase/phosphopantothenate--cysteine ligase